MKNFKLFMGALLFGAMTLASCGDKYYITFENNSQYTVNNNTYQGGGEGNQELPDVPETDKMIPQAGQVTVIIRLADGVGVCNGIGLKGSLNGSDWSGENTYVNATSAQVGREDAIVFEPYKEGTPYYVATYTFGEAGVQGKICQFYTDDSGWQGQAVDVTVDEELTTLTADLDYTISGEGQFTIPVEAAAGVLVLNIGGFQKTECGEVATIDYTVNVTVPAGAPAAGVEIIGSFDGWKGFAMTKVDDTHFTATVAAEAIDEFKFRETGTWDNEIEWLDAESGEWKGLANIKFADEADASNKINLDYSDADKFRWKVTL